MKELTKSKRVSGAQGTNLAKGNSLSKDRPTNAVETKKYSHAKASSLEVRKIVETEKHSHAKASSLEVRKTVETKKHSHAKASSLEIRKTVESKKHSLAKASSVEVPKPANYLAWYVDLNRSKHCLDSLKEMPLCIPQIRWKSPLEFALNTNWRVAAGEESEEVKAHKLREMKVPEAVHPHLSTIPPSLSRLLDVEDEWFDDSSTPVIPIDYVEEEEELLSQVTAALELAPNSQGLSTSSSAATNVAPGTTNSNAPSISQGPTSGVTNIHSCTTALPQGPCPSTILNVPQSNPSVFREPPPTEKFAMLDGATVSTLSAVVSALAKSNERGNLIDTDLLIKVLRDPEMMKKLMEEHGLVPDSKGETSSTKKSEVVPSKLIEKHGGNPPLYETRPAETSVDLPHRGLNKVNLCAKSEDVPGKLIEKCGGPHGGSAPMYESNPVAVSVPLPRSEDDVTSITNLNSSMGQTQPASAGAQALTKPVIANHLHPLPCTNAEVVDNKLNEDRGGSEVVPAVCGSKLLEKSAHLPSLKPEAPLSEIYLNKYRAPAYISEIKPVTLPAPSTLKPNGEMFKYASNDNGAHISAGHKSFLSSKPPVAVPLFGSESDMAKSTHFPSFKHEAHLSETWKNHYIAPAITAGIKPVAPPVPFHGSESNMVKLPHFPSFKPDVPLNTPLNYQYSAHVPIGGMKPVTPPVPNAGMVKQLVNGYGSEDNAGRKLLLTSKPPMVVPFSASKSNMVVPQQVNPYTMPNAPQPNWHRNPFSPSPLLTSPFPPLTTPAPPLKDMSYYKSLVKEHGEYHETVHHTPSPFSMPHNHVQALDLLQNTLSSFSMPHNHVQALDLLQNTLLQFSMSHNHVQALDPLQNFTPTGLSLYQKQPCKFFLTPNGCRNGSNCSYLHDASTLSRPGSVPEAPDAKRMKLAGEFSGR